ncbi:MAG: hypothetical protein Q8R26_00150 [bacterium]|nr:hypothetical protein [bacterium]
MEKCIHCKIETTEITQAHLPSEIAWDHIPSSSWYTDNTPPNIQRWTVPSCRRCNIELGAAENLIRTYIVPGINQDKQEIFGLRERVFRSLGIGLKNKLNPEEFEKRKNGAIKLYKKFRAVCPDMEFYPNFGHMEESTIERQHAVEIPKDTLIKVFGKIFRGAEYILNNKRIIESPFELMVFIGNDILIFRRLDHLFNRTENLGPGFRIQRLAGKESVLYKVMVWGTLIAYGSIDVTK